MDSSTFFLDSEAPLLWVTFSRGWKMTFSLSRPTLKDSKEGTPPLQASHTSYPLYNLGSAGQIQGAFVVVRTAVVQNG